MRIASGWYDPTRTPLQRGQNMTDGSRNQLTKKKNSLGWSKQNKFSHRLHGSLCVRSSFPKALKATPWIFFCLKGFWRRRRWRLAGIHSFPKAVLCCGHYLKCLSEGNPKGDFFYLNVRSEKKRKHAELHVNHTFFSPSVAPYHLPVWHGCRGTLR